MRKLLKYMREYALRCALAPTFKMLEAAAELFVPLVMADIIDVGIKNADNAYILWRCGLLALLAVLGLSFTVTAQYFSATAAVGFTANIKKALYSHIVHLEYKDIDSEGTNSLLSKMTNDLKEIQNGVNLTLRLLARSPFVVFGAAIMAFTVDARSAVIFVVVIPLLLAVVFSIMLSSIPIFKKVQKKLESVLTSVREYLYGVRLIRSFRRDSAEREKFDEKNDSLEKVTLFAGKISALMNPLTFVIINGGIIVLLYSGAVRVSSGRLSQGQVVALYNYMSQILIELLKLASLVISISKALSAASRVEGVFETGDGEDMAESSAPESIEKSDNAVTLTDVTFTYEGAGAPALSDISLSVKREETVGIIGGTGCGKTTLINLISGFYTPKEGKAEIYGKSISDYDKETVRKLFHPVPQKSVLFRGTVRENLLWGGEATDEELWRALETAQAKDFLMEKDGLDTAVGEEGSNFSGGQRQRLCIARALVGNPDFLILDDSASALDLATDKALRTAIKSLDPHPTTFIVSQRTASIMHADKIIVLSDGRCAGVGTHSGLLETCPVYREIYASQFGDEALPPFEGHDGKEVLA